MNNSNSNNNWPPPSLMAIDNGGIGGVERLVDELEALEVSGMYGRGGVVVSTAGGGGTADGDANTVASIVVVAAVTHIAALLYLNDPVSARHLWRRTAAAGGGNNNATIIAAAGAIQPWWMIAKDQLNGNMRGAFTKLQELQQQQSRGGNNNQRLDHPFVQTYAQDIIHSYRCHLLRGWVGSAGASHAATMTPLITTINYAPQLLGFANRKELQDFVVQQRKGGSGATTGTTTNGSSMLLTDIVSFLGSSKLT